MAWAYEFKMGLMWAFVVVVLMAIAIPAELAVKGIWPLILPVVGWIGFWFWVSRIKK